MHAATTTQEPSAAPQTILPRPTRLLVGGGVLLALAVVFIFFLQVAWAMKLATPWYMPIGGTVAALMLTYALTRRRSWWRFGVALVCIALAGLEWFFVLGLTALPAYAGPIAQGGAIPAFHARLADDTEISESYFAKHPATVVVFFQGRWCPFCMTQLRELEAHHEEFARSQAEVLVVSIEDVATAQQTQRDFPHLTVVSDEQRELSDAAELINRGFAPDGGDCATPTILLVDNSGTVRWLHRPTRFIARPSAADLAAQLEKHLPR